MVEPVSADAPVSTKDLFIKNPQKTRKSKADRQKNVSI